MPEADSQGQAHSGSQGGVSPLEVSATDFVHDQLATGRKFRILTAGHTWSKYVPAIDARYRGRGEDVVQTMERICARTGYRRSRILFMIAKC